MMSMAVHPATRGYRVEMLREIIDHRSDVSEYLDFCGSTVLHTAEGKRELELYRSEMEKAEEPTFDPGAAGELEDEAMLRSRMTLMFDVQTQIANSIGLLEFGTLFFVKINPITAKRSTLTSPNNKQRSTGGTKESAITSEVTCSVIAHMTDVSLTETAEAPDDL
uniref:Uncharacterized protein n=1 Tax=Oryza punctata TaxID=4537 RepID=A0A0E0MP02_ORYPU